MSDENFQTNFENEDSNSHNNNRNELNSQEALSLLPLPLTEHRESDSELLQSINTQTNNPIFIDNQANNSVPSRIVDTSNIVTTNNNLDSNFVDPNLIIASSYSRLSRTIGSFLGRTSSATSVEEMMQDESNILNLNETNTQASYLSSDSNSYSTSTSSSAYSLFSTEMKKVKSKFHPKTTKFSSLNSKLSSLNKKKRKANSNSAMRDKFAYLMSNCENYYKSMCVPMENSFNTQTSTNIIKSSLEQTSSLKKLKHDFNDEPQVDQDALELQEFTSQIERELKEFKDSAKSIRRNQEFHLCPLCSHCLFEPVTLVCGCTFCKKCLKELNCDMSSLQLKFSHQQLQQQQQKPQYRSAATCFDSSDSESNEEPTRGFLLKRKINRSNQTTRQLDNFRCFNCGKDHDHNSLNILKQNVLLTDTVEKFWNKNVEIRKLRNDIRNYICFCLENNMQDFDLDKFEYMFKDAYNQDPSNHLLLADLFLLNYFNDFNKDCIRYAEMACELRPDWAFGYYLKSLYYERFGNFNKLKENLLQCLKLDQSLKEVKIKLISVMVDQNKSLLRNDVNHNYIEADRCSNFCENDKLYSSNEMKLESKQMELNENFLDYSLKFDNKSFIQRKSDIKFLKRSKSCDQINIKNMKSNRKFYSCFVDKNSYNGEKPFQIDDTVNTSLLLYQAIAFKIDYTFWSSYQKKEPLDSSVIQNETSKYVVIDSHLAKANDFECSLCIRLLHKPVTTPCGHTFCCSCLDRCLDHQDKCPLCKNSLADYLAERRQFITAFLEKLLRKFYTKDYEERKKQFNEELKELISNENEIPIFVCTLTLPFAPCPLHIYEPRYRLMLRRAIDYGSNQFGMCMYTEENANHITEYGCLLEIKNYQFTRDGRAIVSTFGKKRFKVASSTTKDGYIVAQVEWIKDIRAETDQKREELKALHDEVYDLALKWYDIIPSDKKEKIYEIYGEIPEKDANIELCDDGPEWHWFFINILPLDQDYQYKFLKNVSLYKRLFQMKKILEILIGKYERLQRLRAVSDPILFFNSTNEQANSLDSGRSSSNPQLFESNINSQ